MFIIIFLLIIISAISLLSVIFVHTLTRVFPVISAYRWKFFASIALAAVIIENIFFHNSLLRIPYYTIYIGIGTLFLSLFILIPASLIVRIRHRSLPL